MQGEYFLSYSAADGRDLALPLADKLRAGPPPIRVWLDERELKSAIDWDEQVAEALRSCEALLFLMTEDSVHSESECKREWTRALKYKKPIIPLLFDANAEMPYRLEPRQYIDFTRDYDGALARLRNDIGWRSSPEGVLQSLKDRYEDAERDLKRATEPDRARIEDEMVVLRDFIARQQAHIDNPEAAVKATEKRIESALQREREPSEPIRPETRTKFINPPPATAPSWFQDRHVETRLIGDFLKDDALRLMTIAGRGGIGKTAMVCRLLKSLESGKLPDDLGPMSVDGIVYLSPFGSRQLSFAHLYADLCKLLPDKQAETLLTAYKNPQASTSAKMQALLEAFPAGRTMVLLDNLETVLDSESGEILEEELGEAIVALLSVPHHGVKTIITTRVPPRALLLKQPGRQTRLDLDEGLASPYAENILREMDPSRKLGLKTAPAALLNDARERTRGFPRALEALAGILAADRDTSLPELLEEIEKLQPGEVVEALVGEAFSRLDPLAQQVMQALAIYAYPVVPGAIDYLLQPYLPSIESTPVLRRLVNMQFARSEAGRYHLHHVDREYALSRIPQGEESDRDAEALPFSQFALLKRAADYFEETRTPRESWKSIGDLEPQLAEFELRVAGGEYDAAASVLLEIDFDYLLLWGHVRDAAQLHERLRGHLGDARLRTGNLGILGLCYFRLGEYARAIEHMEQCLGIAREIGERYSEGSALANLGNCYYSLGQYARAIEHHEQSLAIAREIGDRQVEGIVLGNLGVCYDSLGQYARAIEHHEQRLAIAREIGYRRGEGYATNNLGNSYCSLGQYARAIDYQEQQLAIAREIGDKYGEACSVTGLAHVHRDSGEPTRAKQEYEEAIRIAEASADLQNQVEPRYGLAVLQLDVGDLAAAHETITAVRRFNYPTYRSAVCALSGIVALRLGHVAAARADFSMSLTEGDALLAKYEHNLDALNTKGLALSGLVLCGDSGRLAAAIEAYRSARAVSRARGIVTQTLMLLDALAKADTDRILAPVRTAAAGVEPET